LPPLIQGVILWSLGGGILWIVESRVHFNFKHVLGFIAILILLAGIPFLKPGSYADPVVLLALSLSVTAFQFNSYFSGTETQTGRLYALLLFLGAAILVWIGTADAQGWQVVIPLLLTPLFLTALYRCLEPELPLISLRLHLPWLLAALFYPWLRDAPIPGTLALLPWLGFLFLQLQGLGPLRRTPAPLIGLYAVLISFFPGVLHLKLAPGLFTPALLANALVLVPILVVMVLSLRERRLTRSFLLLYLAQEILLDGGIVPSSELAVSQHLMFWRLILFITVNGLYVMVERREFEELDTYWLRGLARVRPRIAFSIIFYMVVVALTPFLIMDPFWIRGWSLLVLHALVGVILSLRWLRSMLADPGDRIIFLRPSLSTWTQVVFIMLITLAYIVNTLLQLMGGSR